MLGLVMSVVLLRRQLASHHVAWIGACTVALLVAISGRWLVAL